MTVEAELRRLGGVARTWQLRRAGVTPDDIATAWADGRIDRLRKGVYALDARSTVAVAAAHGGRVGCVSALRAHGVWLLDADPVVHVIVGHKGRVHPHRECRCVDHHPEGPTAFGVTSVADAIIQAARCISAEALFVAFESAWHLGLLSRADRDRIRAAVRAGLRALLASARPDAESGLESLLRFRLQMIGLRLRSQVEVPGVGRVDFVVGRLIIEVDGRLNHDGPSRRHRDLVRDAAAAARGYRVLRFDYAMVVHDWPTVAAAIQRAV